MACRVARPLRSSFARPRLPIILCLLVVCAALVPAQIGGGFTYVYDELGRLVAVIDPAGETARYTYDAAGNLLSITRQSSSLTSVLEFSPDAGAPGAQVTIYGTGFSTVAGENAVSFNGTAAAVNSATATRLVATVPAGATTGPVSLTTPAGSASSADPFTVTDGAGAPTISGFTPAAGGVGTAVTISGANFDAALLNNKVTFNGVQSPVSAATATQLTTSAPQVGSGRIAVTTPAGKAVSAQDFFIPPAPYTGADVGVTGRITHGGSAAVSVNVAKKVAMISFDGAAEQRTSVKLSGLTGSSTQVGLYRPDGTALQSISVHGWQGVRMLDTTALPVGGTYTIVVALPADSTGAAATSMTLNLYEVPPDVTGTLAPSASGSAATVTTTVPGQNALLTFEGVAGQRVSVKPNRISSPSPNDEGTDTDILKPDGTRLTWALNSNFLETVSLPVTGTYTLRVNPQAAGTGSASLTIYDVTDITGTIAYGEPGATVTVTTPGQNARLTFAGAAGQRVSLKMTNSTITEYRVSLLNPDGSTLVADKVGYMDVATLPADGTYTFLVNPYYAHTGSLKLTLYDVPQDVTAAITPGGPPVTVTTTAPGQNALLTFDGVAGRKVSLKLTNITMASGWAYIRNPDGSTLTSGSFNSGTSGGAFIDAKTLPVTGTYSILINPLESSAGSVTLTLYDVVDIETAITPGGPAATVTNTVPGQNGRLTFTGTAGRQISVKIDSGSYPGAGSVQVGAVSVIKPDGSNLVAPKLYFAAGTFVDATTLPATGSYTILVDVVAAYTGSVNVTLYDVVEADAGTITPGGAAASVSIGTPGQNAFMTFAGTAGQRVSLKPAGVTIATAKISILNPDGTTLAFVNSTPSNHGFIDTQTLVTTGTYKILVDPTGSNTGAATLTLYDVPPDVGGTLSPGGGGVSVSVGTPGQNASPTFAGTAGQQVTVRVTGNTMSTVTVRLLRPDGTQMATATSSAASFNLSTQTLPSTGTYTVSINPSAANTGGLTLTVTTP